LGSEQGGLPYRKAILDWDHVPSDVVLEGAGFAPAEVTIAVTVYRRLEYLFEAVESALRQDWNRPFRIIVFDDDPTSRKAEQLLARLPALGQANFRYYVNRKNLGLFGNWNRCIQLAGSEWMTILNDDDQLDVSFLQLMFAEIDRNTRIDGLVCRKHLLDERAHQTGDLLPIGLRLASRALLEYKFFFRATRRIKPHRLFWEPVLGNGGGFLFRTSVAQEIGGYYPEEFPSSDWWFFTRFAKRYHLRQHREMAASIRMGENESSKVSTMEQGLHSEYRLQQTLAGCEVPRWWTRFTPLILARHRRYLEDYWKVQIPQDEIEQKLNVRLPTDRPRLYKILQILTGGT
jgi:glycosyltransferase involved in cell wall biosynthesis